MLNEKQWIYIMRYIREVSGTVYENQLRDILSSLTGDTIVEEINADILNNCYGRNQGCYRFLKKDRVTGGLYTIPSQRQELDRLIKDYCDSHPAEFKQGEYVYNKHLYDPEAPDESSFAAIDLDNKNEIKKLFDCGVFSVTAGVLNIDFSSFGREKPIKNFNIANICKASDEEIVSIGYINGENMCFTGSTVIAFEDLYNSPFIKFGVYFNGSTFFGDLTFQNILIKFEKESNRGYASKRNKLDFRNVRFFGDVSFKDVVFGGSTNDSEISFEDARIKKGKVNKLEFINVDFADVKLNFFQITVGDFTDSCRSGNPSAVCQNLIEFANVSLSESSCIDFSDAEVDNGRIVFKNIFSLPILKLCFLPVYIISDGSGKATPCCPENTLIIENCEIRQTVSIANISQLSFKNSRNYGKIISGQEWADISPAQKSYSSVYKSKSKGLFGVPSLGGLKITDKLLLAVYNYSPDCKCIEDSFYNNCSKAKDFLMLKENFASMGEYDDEDDAFILYMEYKPCLIKQRKPSARKSHRMTDDKGSLWYRLLFRFLYVTGKFGISPLRVIISIAFLISIFTVIYCICASLQDNAFSLGNTLNSNFGASNGIMAEMGKGFQLQKLWASLLYSIEGVIPFVSQFEAISSSLSILTAVENAIGSFLVGYFSVAVIRKTLR